MQVAECGNVGKPQRQSRLRRLFAEFILVLHTLFNDLATVLHSIFLGNQRAKKIEIKSELAQMGSVREQRTKNR